MKAARHVRDNGWQEERMKLGRPENSSGCWADSSKLKCFWEFPRNAGGMNKFLFRLTTKKSAGWNTPSHLEKMSSSATVLPNQPCRCLLLHRGLQFSHPKGTALGDAWVKSSEDTMSSFTLLANLQMRPYKQACIFSQHLHLTAEQPSPGNTRRLARSHRVLACFWMQSKHRQMQAVIIRRLS